MARTAIPIDQQSAARFHIDQEADPEKSGLPLLVPRSAATMNPHRARTPMQRRPGWPIDLPLGAWMTAQLFDTIVLLGGPRRLRRNADLTLSLGLVGAGIAALGRLAGERMPQDDSTRRPNRLVSAARVAVVGLYGASLIARQRHQRRLGVALSSAGFGLLVFGSWLGGALGMRTAERLEGSGA
ncbi:DUF2231 domain-containing protein [Chondromyces crocatus]|uniref:DUF2231 domain-containing protein n=1 Tax=Chondromyces crocatus TaxID=52 RepID=A0A0K1E618_CHOCO|nr:DUF2231 domain-containing protein [Chondromyces crocatus]AKT36326.1 uncharacterized protein CMC5_004400 [Chondromyces crocatus]